MSDLMEIIHEDVEVQRFEVKDLDTANWAIGKALAAESNIQRIRALADEYRARIDKWESDATKADLATVEFMQSQIRPFVEREVAGTNKQSMKLLGATAGFRKTPASVVIEDEGAIVEYCETFAPELVRVKKSVDKTEMRKRIEKGEVFDGAHLEPGSVKFYVKMEEE